MNRVRINGQSYALPFENLLPRLSPDRTAALRASIAKFGVQVPIVVFLSPSHGRAVIDGMNRAEIALDFCWPVPCIDMADLDDDVAKELALSLNADRRQLTVEQLKEARAKLDALIPALRQAGKSERLIGEAVGRSQFFVHSVLNQPTDFGKSVDEEDDDDELPPPPSRITGRNGKSYAATAPRRPEPDDDEILRDLAPPSQSDRVATAEDAAVKRLARALADAHGAFTDLAELNGPRFRRFVKFAKENKVSVRNGEWRVLEAMRAAVDSLTAAAGKRA